jgi:hypothetical protein
MMTIFGPVATCRAAGCTDSTGHATGRPSAPAVIALAYSLSDGSRTGVEVGQQAQRIGGGLHLIAPLDCRS